MSLTNAQYDQIMRRYDENHRNAIMDRDSRIEYVMTHVAGYRELQDQVSKLTLDHTRRAVSGDKDALPKLHSLLADINLRKQQLIAAANLPTDYLDIHYTCQDCQDTGYIDGRKCHCFEQQINSVLYDQSGIKDSLSQIGFHMVSDKFYTGDDLAHFQDTLSKAHNFIDNFDNDYQNLLFYGTVGSGKSLLSSCIARELLSSGHSVIYFSASSLFDTLSRETFDHKNGRSTSNNLYDCDLLIIDDLGTEFTNNYTISALFALLNERALRRQSVIISTNLTLENLRDRYTDRTFSRITGSFTLCRLTGPDIRIAHKFINN